VNALAFIWIVFAALPLLAQAPPAEKWANYVNKAPTGLAGNSPSIWVEANQSISELPANDWRRLMVLNRLIFNCDSTYWLSPCPAEEQRQSLLASALAASKLIQPRDAAFAEELHLLARVHGPLDEPSIANQLIEESLQIMSGLDGPPDEKRYSFYLRTTGIARLGKIPVWPKTCQLALQEIDALHSDAPMTLLVPYISLVENCPAPERKQIAARYIEILNQGSTKGSAIRARAL